MSILVLAVRVAGKALLATDGAVLFVKALPSRVMDRVNEFLKSRPLVVAERPRDLVAAACVDIHRHLDSQVVVAWDRKGRRWCLITGADWEAATASGLIDQR